MNICKYLLPNRLRILGIIFLTIGIVLLILKYKFNYKPEFLNLKVFALYSFYIEAKTFEMIRHQMIADIAGIFLIAGLFILSFTKEKNESEALDSIRLKAFILTAYVNFFYLLASILFFFGFGFVGAITFYAVIWIAVYFLLFRWLLFRKNKADIIQE